MRYRYVAEPHPHLVVDEIVPADTYEALRFPDELIARGEAWGITASDPQFDRVVQDPGWRAFVDELTSEPFVRGVLRSFAADMACEQCLTNPESARLTAYLESRAEKEQRALAGPADPNELFTRFDFQSKGEGDYRHFIHLDWPRRIATGVLFFSDAAEEGLEGGELAFYRDRQFANDRWCHDPEIVALFPPRRNSGVIFLNSNRAFHGPRRITRLRGRRRWVNYAISSRANVWPHAPRVPELAAAAVR